MTLKVFLCAILGIILLFGVAPMVAAKSPSASTKLTHPEVSPADALPNTTGPIVTDSGITQAYNTWSAQITPGLSFIGGVFGPGWQRRSVGANLPTRQQQIAAAGNYQSLEVPVQLYYGLTPR